MLCCFQRPCSPISSAASTIACMDEDGADGQPELPFTFRIGAVGAGIGVGCGLGVGFGKPLNLGNVPGIGQAIYGISSGLGALGGPLAGFGHAARGQLQRLGIQGLDAGFGCGVGVGYGFGAGLMLKPSAVQQLSKAMSNAAGSAGHFVHTKLVAAGLAKPRPAPAALQGGPQPGGGFEGPLGPYAGNWDFPMAANPLQQQQQVNPTHATAVDQHRAGSAADDVLQLLLQQQLELNRLKQKTKSLQRAVCKLDSSAPFCSSQHSEDE